MKIMNFRLFFVLVCLLKMVCYTMLICATAGAVCHVRLAAWQVIDPHFIAEALRCDHRKQSAL
jgi:hypothetical protein